MNIVDLFNPFSAGSPLGALVGDNGLFTNPSGAWDNFKNGRTNEVNERIAEKNLEYQRERNAIDDARYEDETAYQRALQQQIFDREDTAIERQAQSLSKLGINPLSQQLNGLGAGQGVVAQMSTGGHALHNDFQMQDKGLLEAVAPIMTFANSIGNLNTQGVQRDKLREEVDMQKLKNQEQALLNENLENKIKTEQEQREEDLRHSKEYNPHSERDIEATANRNQREDIFQRDFGALDNSPREMRWATESAYQADRALNTGTKVVGDVASSATKALAKNAQKVINNYNKATKKASDWISEKVRKAKNWFKSNTASSDEVRNMYGF